MNVFTSRYRKYGQTNHRKILRMADSMAKEAEEKVPNLPDWAGLAWIISGYYNSRAHVVKATMGDEWWARAEMLCKALTICRC